jgi:hypothetical protein
MIVHHRILLVGVLAIIPLFAPGRGLAQDQQTGVDSSIESLRADMRADKVQIITQAMKFSDKDAAVFWPIYKKYAYDLSTLNDQRVQLIKEYSEKYPTMNDADAKAMADKMFKYESQRIDFKKKYFKEFNKALPALTVVKFFQLENRLDLLVDVALASQLPPLLARPSTGQ